MEASECAMVIKTAESGWSINNPQGLIYLDGEMTQGIDANHSEVLLEFNRSYNPLIYLYTGAEDSLCDFIPSLYIIDKKTEKLYYDLHVPLEACK